MSDTGNGSKIGATTDDSRSEDGEVSSGERGSQPTMCLTSDEVNYLIFRYLQESGFVHSAFTFVYESMLGRSNIRNADKSIPPGALITFLQKGMQYVGIEESLNRDGQKGRKNQEEEVSSISLLAPQTISALTRENPPIQLNVPPATAAAAVRARLEAEAKLESERKKAAVKEAAEQVLASGATKITGPSGLPPQVSLKDPHQLARNVMASQASVQHQLSQIDSAGAAAAIMAQQRREVAAQMAVLQEEQLHHQLQLQQQLQQEQILQQQSHQMGGSTEETAAAVASVAGQLSGSKRAAATGKKSLKKAKSKQQAKKPTQQSEESEIATTSSSQDTTGFASLGEAAARLEAANDPQITSTSDEPTPMDVEENDQAASAPSQPAHVPREKETLNGNHRPPNGTKDGSEPDTPGHHRKEGGPSKGPNAVIVKEDELTNARPEEVLELNSHSSEVFMCAWNPIFTDIIATGSGDASARIWQMGGKKASDGLGPVCYLPHGSGPEDKMNKDVTTLEWSSDGNLLATGSYDGVARVWNRAGELVKTLRGHKGPIFSLKWNKRGNYLLSGSYDQTTIVWDVSGENGFVEQQFADHTAPALDVDWKDDVTFASCSTDRTVHICRVGTSKPLKIYSGHGDEVNGVKWDPSGRLLASCSDDCTAKVWDLDSDQTGPVQDFRSHKQEIYTVKWSPTGPGSKNPEKQPMLATASFDGSVRLWNVKDGTCMQVFNRHRESVYSVSFSPSGSFLASGSLSGQLYIWNVQEGKHIKSFKGKGDIFEVAWNKEESRVAACFSSNVVCIIDFETPQPAALPIAN